MTCNKDHNLIIHDTILPTISNNVYFFLWAHSASAHHLFLCATKSDSPTLSVLLVLYLQGVSGLLEMLKC